MKVKNIQNISQCKRLLSRNTPRCLISALMACYCHVLVWMWKSRLSVPHIKSSYSFSGSSEIRQLLVTFTFIAWKRAAQGILLNICFRFQQEKVSRKAFRWHDVSRSPILLPNSPHPTHARTHAHTHTHCQGSGMEEDEDRKDEDRKQEVKGLFLTKNKTNEQKLPRRGKTNWLDSRQGKAGQGWTGQGRTGQDRAGQGWTQTTSNIG